MTVLVPSDTRYIGGHALPSGWNITTLGEIFEIHQGKALSPSVRTANERFPFLRTANVLWGSIDITTVDSMGLTANERRQLALRNGDLLVCEGGEIGRCAIWRAQLPECYYQNHLHRLRPLTPDTHPEFYAYWIQAAFTRLGIYEGVGNRTTIPNLSRARLAALAVPDVAGPEQQRIARVLSTIQSSLEKTRAVLSSLALVRRSLIDDSLRRSAVGGGTVRLKSLVERPQYGLTASAAVRDGPRFLRITDITEEGIDWSTVPSCATDPPAGTRYTLLDGDLVVARIGATTGKAWLVRQPPEAVFASYLIRIRPRPGVDARFLAAFFDSDDYRAQINASKGGRLKGGVNIENLNSLLVPVLSETPQAELVERIDRIDTCLVATRRVREALAAVFDASLQALLGRNR